MTDVAGKPPHRSGGEGPPACGECAARRPSQKGRTEHVNERYGEGRDGEGGPAKGRAG